MSEKALALAFEQIKAVYTNDFPYYSDAKVSNMAENAIKIIDWNNSALMHKDLKWIARFYAPKVA